ncbi:MAG: sugar ABC transporter substrate-binding protein [Firmicutes bacterium HGW-Firmicutes-11]|jgi:ABC-type glycerol-3-phosphate transport system substrate-binding protein|nr:MAG: sugar ABC transporter substrate-binding protein [Firmicutes bacterium HGW-Firmicutes-11]
MEKANNPRVRVWLLLVLVLMATGGFGCAGDPQEAEEPPEPNDTLQFRITWQEFSGRGEAVKRIVSAYQPEKEAIKINVIGGDEDLNTMEEILLKEPTDTILVMPYRFIKHFGAKGLLQDLTTDFIGDKDLFYPELWDLAIVEGRTFGVPWVGHAVSLIYNKELLRTAGVDPAAIRSLDDLVAAMERVEAETPAKGIGLVGADHNDVSWMVNQFIYSFGGTLVDSDGSSVKVNSEEAMQAIAFYRDVLGPHAQPTWTEDTGVEVMKHFLEQTVAFEFQGVWGVTDVQKNGAPFETGVIALNDLGMAAEVGPLMLAIPASFAEEHRKSAVDFLRYLISVPAQERVMNGEYSPERDAYYPFRVPVRIDMKDSQLFDNYPQYLPFIEGMQNPSIDVPVPGWATIKELYYAPGLHRVMTGESTIEDFLIEIEGKGNDILDQQKQGGEI